MAQPAPDPEHRGLMRLRTMAVRCTRSKDPLFIGDRTPLGVGHRAFRHMSGYTDRGSVARPPHDRFRGFVGFEK
jgi:hypothetical protein